MGCALQGRVESELFAQSELLLFNSQCLEIELADTFERIT